ncbi:hypothetical protein F2Q69_00060257 [Brassica cretica]|uniref:RNase H type-1 domain-containing protein n=1 Tax=Brassica cretica TaxID=69181 RepID=A0A8S9RKD4_BRACR|nr:hypothetical protein F2Q69_00060257 [Brassica cretica]
MEGTTNCYDSGSVFLTHRHNVASALVAETLAIRAAIAWAATSVSSNERPVVVLSDTKVLVDLLNTKKIDVKLQSVRYDIYDLDRPLVSISFKFIPRLENSIADLVAKTALFQSVNSSCMK